MLSATSYDLDTSRRPVERACILREDDVVELKPAGGNIYGTNVAKDSNGLYSLIEVQVVTIQEPRNVPNLCHEGEPLSLSIAGLSGLPGYYGCTSPAMPAACPRCRDTSPKPTTCADGARGSGCCSVTHSPPTCECITGWTAPRAGCQRPCARGILRCNNQGDCSTAPGRTTTNGNGVDVPFTGPCACATGYFGRECELSCPVDRAGAVCSGRGQCIAVGAAASPPQCLCDDGFAGIDCSIALAPVCGTTPALPTSSLCFGRGLCITA